MMIMEMLKKPKPKPEQEVMSFITSRRWFLKKHDVPRSRWRRQIAEEFLDISAAKAEAFVAAWEYLEKRGLI